MNKINRFFWIFPFLFFVLGYNLPHIFFPDTLVSVPNIIGKPLHKGVSLLSSSNLSLLLLREKEVPDLEEGIILEQIPSPSKKIKPNYHVYVTVSKKPKAILMPNFLGKTLEEIIKEADNSGIKISPFWHNSPFLTGRCFAQYPSQRNYLVSRDVTVYLSLGNSSLHMISDFRGHPILDVLNFLDGCKVECQVFHKKSTLQNHECKNCCVLEQSPMPGSIIDFNKKFSVQLLVE